MSKKESAAAFSAAEKENVSVEKAETKKQAGKQNKAVVFCAPTVKGVARQYTVFTQGLPEHVLKWVEEHTSAKALIVPVERFADVRKKLSDPKSAENIISRKLEKEAK